MKETKFFLLLLMISVLFFSCGSDDGGDDVGGDDNPTADAIIGNWRYIGDIDEDGYTEDEQEPCDYEFLKFNSNATVVSTVNYCGEQTEVYNYFWQKTSEANKYILSDGEGQTEEVKIVFSQNNTRMTLYEFEDEDGFYGIVYQRQ